MQYQFDQYIDRLNTACIKWDFQAEDFGENGLLPFWIADSDFEVLPEVRSALLKRISHPIYGYSDADQEYFEAVISWFEKRHGWKIEREMIVPTSGVVPSIAFAIEAFSKEGDKIMVQSPIYDPFYVVIEKNKRELVTSNLIYENTHYKMDFEDMEKKMAEGVKIFILCSPHNPVGRVWKQEELKKVARLCAKYKVMLISDEIHCDLTMEGNKHVSMGTFEEIEDRLIVCTAASKTFNLAGLQTSNIIIPCPKIKAKYWETTFSKFWLGPNVLGLTATKNAYKYGGEWVDQQRAYIQKNIEYTKSFIKEKIPRIKVTDIEGTYLMWLDFSALGFTSDQVTEKLASRGIALNNGAHYGKNGEGYMRLNVACQLNTLKKGLTIIKEWVDGCK